MESVPVVLVVEDEEPLQEIVHDALKEGGFDLTTVVRLGSKTVLTAPKRHFRSNPNNGHH